MSSPASAAPDVALRLSSSPGLACAIVLGWVPLLLLTWTVGSGSVWGLPLVLLLAILAVVSAVRGGGLVAHERFSGLILRDNRLLSHDSHGVLVEWTPKPSCRLFSRLAWLELGTDDPSKPLKRLVVTDLPALANLPPDDFRQLRVWLRLGASYH